MTPRNEDPSSDSEDLSSDFESSSDSEGSCSGTKLGNIYICKNLGISGVGAEPLKKYLHRQLDERSIVHHISSGSGVYTICIHTEIMHNGDTTLGYIYYRLEETRTYDKRGQGDSPKTWGLKRKRLQSYYNTPHRSFSGRYCTLIKNNRNVFLYYNFLPNQESGRPKTYDAIKEDFKEISVGDYFIYVLTVKRRLHIIKHPELKRVQIINNVLDIKAWGNQAFLRWAPVAHQCYGYTVAILQKSPDGKHQPINVMDIENNFLSNRTMIAISESHFACSVSKHTICVYDYSSGKIFYKEFPKGDNNEFLILDMWASRNRTYVKTSFDIIYMYDHTDKNHAIPKMPMEKSRKKFYTDSNSCIMIDASNNYPVLFKSRSDIQFLNPEYYPMLNDNYEIFSSNGLYILNCSGRIFTFVNAGQGYKAEFYANIKEDILNIVSGPGYQYLIIQTSEYGFMSIDRQERRINYDIKKSGVMIKKLQAGKSFIYLLTMNGDLYTINDSKRPILSREVEDIVVFDTRGIYTKISNFGNREPSISNAFLIKETPDSSGIITTPVKNIIDKSLIKHITIGCSKNHHVWSQGFCVYSFGKNNFGQIALPPSNDLRTSAKPLHNIVHDKITGVYAGEKQTYCLTLKGKLFARGCLWGPHSRNRIFLDWVELLPKYIVEKVYPGDDSFVFKSNLGIFLYKNPKSIRSIKTLARINHDDVQFYQGNGAYIFYDKRNKFFYRLVPGKDKFYKIWNPKGRSYTAKEQHTIGEIKHVTSGRRHMVMISSSHDIVYIKFNNEDSVEKKLYNRLVLPNINEQIENICTGKYQTYILTTSQKLYCIQLGELLEKIEWDVYQVVEEKVAEVFTGSSIYIIRLSQSDRTMACYRLIEKGTYDEQHDGMMDGIKCFYPPELLKFDSHDMKTIRHMVPGRYCVLAITTDEEKLYCFTKCFNGWHSCRLSLTDKPIFEFCSTDYHIFVLTNNSELSILERHDKRDLRERQKPTNLAFIRLKPIKNVVQIATWGNHGFYILNNGKIVKFEENPTSKKLVFKCSGNF